MGDLDSVVKLISGLGVTGVLLLLIYGLLKGWFVTGREHGVLVGLYTAVQTDMTAMRGELKSLRDRDTTQQDQINQQLQKINGQQVEINDLHRQLIQEQSLKSEALAKLTEAQRTITGLQSRVAELERQVGVASNNTR